METILWLVGIYIVIDVYYRLRSYRRSIRLLLTLNDVINRALLEKGVVTKEEIKKAQKEVLGNMYIGDYNSLRKDLLKMGIDIEK